MDMTKTGQDGEEILDFDIVEVEFDKLSVRARLTLMYRLVQLLPSTVLRITIKYCGRRLDKLRSELPDNHPEKLKYQRRAKVLSLDGIRHVTDERPEECERL